jgi:uncharacterized membrane protein
MLKLFKKSKGKDSSRNNIILHNVYILYLIFIVALINFLTFVYSNDYYSASIFVLVGLLTSFFSKNMIVILFIAIAITNILKYGSSAASVEGFDSLSKKDKTTAASTAKPTAASTAKPTAASTAKPTAASTAKPTAASTTASKKSSQSDKTSSFSVDQNPAMKKEHYSQDAVYTSDEDRELAKTEKLILSQEKLLKSMNRYKPLLDTLQGITKNMAVVKGAASFSDA